MNYYEQTITPEIPETTQRICIPFTDTCWEQVITPHIPATTQRMPNGWRYEEKTNAINQFINANSENTAGTLNFNFLSALGDTPTYFPVFTSGIHKNAEQQNQFIERKNWKVNGMIFPMDYPSDSVITKIIDSNL